jgi:CDP-diacylglycerol--glycerol-3-phosphate 3-phosphatidyltransferase
MRPNLPNTLTLFRILMVPLLMVFMLTDSLASDIVALVVFLAAAVSDFLDGFIARRWHQTTALGAFLDPLADKLLVTAALVSLVDIHELSAWIAMVVIARELAVTGLRMVAAAKGVVISASIWGKVKTLSQLVAIACLIIEPRWIKPEWTVWGQKITWWLVMLMLALTVVSGIDYFVRAWRPVGGPLPQDGTRLSAFTKKD